MTDTGEALYKKAVLLLKEKRVKGGFSHLHGNT
jgi:hypothetical protein